jgi:hypothetical protein
MLRLPSYQKILFLSSIFFVLSSTIWAQEKKDSINFNNPHLEEFAYPFSDLNYISPRFDHINQNNGSYYNTYLLRTVLTIPNIPLHFRIDLPFATSNASGLAITGLDDISLRSVFVFHQVKRWLSGAGLKLIIPTSSNRNIGSGAWQLNPTYGFLNVFRDSKGSFGLSTDYRFSISSNKYGNPNISVLGIAPTLDYWGKNSYLGYYPTYTYNFISKSWVIPFDVEFGYQFVKKWWASIEYIVPMGKNKPFKDEFGIKLRHNFSRAGTILDK